MLRNKLVRSDGSIIGSSVIISCEFTEEVNSSTNLSVGDVTASELTVEILATDPIQQDEVLTYYIIEDGREKKIGVFKAEKPTVATRTSMRFSAYDNIIKTEKLFSDWLRANQSLFPMPLINLVEHACSHCGVVLATTDFPHADLSVDAFYADNLTCRQILSWAAAIAGRFVRANAEGELEFAWYVDAPSITVAPSESSVNAYVNVRDDGAGNVSLQSKNIAVSDDGNGNVTLLTDGLSVTTNENGITFTSEAVAIPFMRDKLSYENYSTDLIERVQINHSEDDVGVIYPADVAGNCFTISENMILGVADHDDVTQVAMSLHSHLKDITYVPFSVTVPRTILVRAGDIVSVTDSSGNSFAGYVMKMSVTPTGTTLTATGDKSYGSNAAVSSEKYSNLTGKILSLSKSIDGLTIKNEDLNGKFGELTLSTEAFKTEIKDTYVSEEEFGEYKNTVSTSFEQTAEQFEMKFNSTSQAISDVNKDLQEKYNERTSYIRFEDGNIILGRSDSDITLKQSNDRISFLQNGQEVAYIADDNLYITQGEFMTQLRIGKFGFTPGASGNLSFKKVVD
jgi:hypothetical protein